MPGNLGLLRVSEVRTAGVVVAKLPPSIIKVAQEEMCLSGQNSQCFSFPSPAWMGGEKAGERGGEGIQFENMLKARPGGKERRRVGRSGAVVWAKRD